MPGHSLVCCGPSHAQSLAKHATMALAVLLREPAGAYALLGRGPCRAPPPGLAAAMRVRLCDADAREPVLLAALEVRPCAIKCAEKVASVLTLRPTQPPLNV